MDCEPKRLLESDGLAPGERSALEAGRAQRTHYDVERGALRFRATLAALPPVKSGSPAAGTTPKVKLALVLSSAATLFVFWRAPLAPDSDQARPKVEASAAVDAQPARVGPASVAQAAAEEPAPLALAPQVRVDSPPQPPMAAQRPKLSAARLPKRKPVATSPHTSPPLIIEPGIASNREREREPAPKREPEPEPTAPKPATQAVEQHSESMDELRATARARSLLTRDPQAALTLLDRLASLHPHGYFGEERAALRVFALLALSRRSDARDEAEQFLRAYPRSAFAAQVQRAAER